MSQRLTDLTGTYRLIEQIAVDHIATLRWIEREWPSGWNDEFDRRLRMAIAMAERIPLHCQDCNGIQEHAAGTNGDVCLNCGRTQPARPF